uniref:Uncharacterized protein n=1 Tax=Caulobacter sp. (strain K31) TaxID=366602 RepID=B0SZ46_CAUSK
MSIAVIQTQRLTPMLCIGAVGCVLAGAVAWRAEKGKTS